MKNIGIVFAALYTKTAEPIEMQFDGLALVDSRKYVLDGGQGRTNPFAAARGDNSLIACQYLEL